MQAVEDLPWQGNLSSFLSILEEASLSGDKGISSLYLRSKIDRHNVELIESYISLANQRAEIMHLNKQLQAGKNFALSDALNRVSNLCLSVLSHARERLDNEAMEMAAIANELSIKSHQLLENFSSKDIDDFPYHFKSLLDPLIIKCHTYLRCDLPLPTIPVSGSCLPDQNLPLNICTSVPEERVTIPICGGVLNDYEKPVPYCGVGDLIKSDPDIIPCNHSILAGFPSLIDRNKAKATSHNPSKTQSSKPITTGASFPVAAEMPPLVEIADKGNEKIDSNDKTQKIKQVFQTGEEIRIINRNRAIQKIQQKKLKILREGLKELIESRLTPGSNKLINEISDKIQGELYALEKDLVKTLQVIDGIVIKQPLKGAISTRVQENMERLLYFDGSNLPEAYRSQLPTIKWLIDKFKDIPGALEADGPIERLIRANFNMHNRVQGALYELLVADQYEKLGFRIKYFHRNMIISDEQKVQWNTSKKVIEFDIELENGTYVEAKNINWDIVDNYIQIADIIEERSWLNDLNYLQKLSWDEVKQRIDEGSISTVQKMFNLVQQIKVGHDMALFLKKDYLFYSYHAIPPIIKKWLEGGKIKFSEKNCRNCKCENKYKNDCICQ